MIRIRHRAALLAIGALALAGVAAGLAQPSLSSAAHSAPELPANPLLPNLGALPPRDIDIVQVRVKNSVEKRLRFDTLMANTGEGPLEVFPGGTGTTLCPTHASLPTQEAWQRVYIDNNSSGVFERTPTATVPPDGSVDRFVGCMVLHPKHRHWHVEGFAAYRLYDVANNNLVASSEKVSFCMLDMERVPGAAVTVAAPYYITCGRNATMGISAGWADEYYSGLADQWIKISGTQAETTGGDYCLVNIANIAANEPAPNRNGLIESDHSVASNAAGVQITISNNGTAVSSSGSVCSTP